MNSNQIVMDLYRQKRLTDFIQKNNNDIQTFKNMLRTKNNVFTDSTMIGRIQHIRGSGCGSCGGAK